MATTWTPTGRCQGYRVTYGRNAFYQAGRVEVLDGENVVETIEFRFRGRAIDVRGMSDLHAADDSPRGSLREQIRGWVQRNADTMRVEFCSPDAPYA